MRAALPVLLSVLLLASGARAADALEAARAEVRTHQQRAMELRQEQLRLGGRIGALSQEIETLKGQGTRGDAKRLDAALKESQALSATLGDVTRAQSAGERELEQARTRLLTGLGEALVQLRAGYDRTEDRGGRARLLEQMRGLRSESERLRGQLPPALLPNLPAEVVRSDDPEDLLAQADVLRDHEDRLKARLTELRARLKQARAEADLSRRMDDFLGEASLFDEQDRSRPGRGGQFAGAEVPTPPESTNGPSNGAGDPGVPREGQGDNFEFISASSRRPGGTFEVAPLAGRRGPGNASEDVELGVAQLEQLQRQLEARAKEYGARAAALEQRAKGR